jgi:glycosyltransferase involved in cell wall biosynthesis
MAFLAIAESARDPRLEFVMTGAGPLEAAVRRRVAQSDGAVQFLGVVEDIKEHVAGLDVLVVPSRQDGRPIVVLEALALGVPVLATRIGGLPELVRDGETGFLCEPGDVDGFRDRLYALASDRAGLARLQRSARAYAERHLDAVVMHTAYERALARLVHRPAGVA